MALQYLCSALCPHGIAVSVQSEHWLKSVAAGVNSPLGEQILECCVV